MGSEYTRAEDSSPWFSYKRRRRKPETYESSDDEDYHDERKSTSKHLTEDEDITKLTIDKAHILAILKAKPGYRPPRPMNPNRPPSTKFCEYHEDTRHTIERCYQLKKLIEDKIQSERLSHFAVKDDHPPPQPQYDQDRIIHFISGGHFA
ncbi:hypothetical protein AgCh_034309 [Apium graveolens]